MRFRWLPFRHHHLFAQEALLQYRSAVQRKRAQLIHGILAQGQVLQPERVRVRIL
jgi:hypothetical protein